MGAKKRRTMGWMDSWFDGMDGWLVPEKGWTMRTDDGIVGKLVGTMGWIDGCQKQDRRWKVGSIGG